MAKGYQEFDRRVAADVIRRRSPLPLEEYLDLMEATGPMTHATMKAIVLDLCARGQVDIDTHGDLVWTAP